MVSKELVIMAFLLLASVSIAFTQETDYCEGDFDCDFDVDGLDIAKFYKNNGRNQFNNPCTNDNPCVGDFDCDGDVDYNDQNWLIEDFHRSIYNNPCYLCQKIICDYPEICSGDCYEVYPNFCPDWEASNCASGKCGYFTEGVSIWDRARCIGSSTNDDPCDVNYLGLGCCYVGNGWYWSNGTSGSLQGIKKVCCEGVLKEGQICYCSYIGSSVVESQIKDCCTGKAGIYKNGKTLCIYKQTDLGPGSCFWLEQNGELYVHNGYTEEFFTLNHICEEGLKKKTPLPCQGGYFGEEMIGRVTSSSAVINMVPCQDNLSVYAEYGTMSGSYDKQTHILTGFIREALEIELPELEPDTRYYYRIVEKLSDESSFSPRREGSFTTKKNPGSPFSFAVTADIHFTQIKNTPSQIQLLEQTLQNILEDNVDFHIDLGDSFCTDYGITSDHPLDIKDQREAFIRYEDLRKYYNKTHHSIPFYLVLGNHEGELGFYFKHLAAWSENARKVYVLNPNSNTYPEGGSNDENYYAFTWGNALFVILDPFRYTIKEPTSNENSLEDWTLGSAQICWLQSILQNSNAKYKFIFIHHLVGGCNAYGRGGVKCVADGEWGYIIHRMLVENNVSIVFHGHDHAFVDEIKDGIRYTEVPNPHTKETPWAKNDDLYNINEVLESPGHIKVSVSDHVVVQYIGSSLDESNKEIKYTYGFE